MSLRLRLIPPQARQLVEMHQSVGNAKGGGKKKERKERERTSAWHLPDDYIRKTFQFLQQRLFFPSSGAAAARV